MDEYFFPWEWKRGQPEVCSQRAGQNRRDPKEVPVWYRWCVFMLLQLLQAEENPLFQMGEDVFLSQEKSLLRALVRGSGHRTHRGRRGL